MPAPAVGNHEEVTRRAEHRLAMFILTCVVISLIAGFIAYVVAGYSVGSFVMAGLLFGTLCGGILFGRRKGIFSGDHVSPMRRIFRLAAWGLGVLFMVCGGMLVVIAAIDGPSTMLFGGFNTFVTGALFLLVAKTP
jgi:hypothetical protein